jgi:hypothetical protein
MDHALYAFPFAEVKTSRSRHQRYLSPEVTFHDIARKVMEMRSWQTVPAMRANSLLPFHQVAFAGGAAQGI